jgi:hypothetical protein
MAKVIIKNSGDKSDETIPMPAPNVPDAIAEQDDILSLLADPNETLVVRREVEIKGQTREVFIKKLSIRQNNWIESQKFRRGAGGAVTFDARNADTNMTAHLLHLAIVQNVGTPDNPIWQSRWTLEQLLGAPEQGSKPAKAGLLDGASGETKLLIFNLAALATGVNDEINPTVTVPEAA